LFNPFSDDAIVDVTFNTSDGDAIPEAFQGIPVAAGHMVVLDVSGNVRRRDYVATSISLRSGRLVAAQLQTGVIGGNPVAGYTVGQPALAIHQYIPDVQTADGRHTVLSLFNPGDQESHVRIDNALSKATAQPFDLRVPADSRVTVNFDTEPRIPKGTTMGAHIQVLNGVPVASQLTVTGGPPSAFTGGSFVTLPAHTAPQLMFASGATSPNSDSWVEIYNPNTVPANVRVTLTGDGNASTQAPVVIQPDKQYVFHVNDLSPNATGSIVINSDQNIVASREISVVGGAGPTIEAAVPVR
jgi:hypothetical protein